MLDGERPEGRRGPLREERWAWRKGWGESLAKVWAGKESVCEVLEGAAGWIAIVGREAKVWGGGIIERTEGSDAVLGWDNFAIR